MFIYRISIVYLSYIYRFVYLSCIYRKYYVHDSGFPAAKTPILAECTRSPEEIQKEEDKKGTREGREKAERRKEDERKTEERRKEEKTATGASLTDTEIE